MSDDTQIRVRQPQDLPGAASVLRNVYNSDGYPVEGVADPFPFLDPPNMQCAWIASVQDRIVGHALVTEAKSGDAAVDAWTSQGNKVDSIAVLGRLFVDSSVQGLGLGARLVQTATAWAEQNGQRLVLLVIEKDKAATHIYEKYGWLRTGTTTYRSGKGTDFVAHLYVSPPLIK